MKSKFLILALTISAFLNIVLFYLFAHQALEGCAEIANGRLGILTKDTEVGYFDGNATVFTLPKGLVVREASASGAGWFEPERFRIVVTSDSESLVDYSINEEKLERQDSEYYSTEIRRNESLK